jgi:hypothetical protein
MEKVEIFVDEKRTIWHRTTYSLEKDFVKFLDKEKIRSLITEDLEYDFTEYLYDTVDEMGVEENGNQSTLEVLIDSGVSEEVIWDNKSEEIKKDLIDKIFPNKESKILKLTNFISENINNPGLIKGAIDELNELSKSL